MLSDVIPKLDHISDSDALGEVRGQFNGGTTFETLANITWERTANGYADITGDTGYFLMQSGNLLVFTFGDDDGGYYGESTAYFTIDANFAAVNAKYLGMSFTDAMNQRPGDNNANSLLGDAGRDYFNGLGGNDTVDAGAGDDVSNGGDGDDTAAAGDGDDLVLGGNGNDQLSGGAGNDDLRGGEGNDTLNGGSGADTLDGGNGDNILDGGSGGDTLIGGIGNNTYIVDSVSDIINEKFQSSFDQDLVRSSVTIAQLADNVENIELTGTANINATGNSLDNNITGNDGDNILDGGARWDIMSGGSGNDTYVVDSTGDLVSEGTQSGSGIDTVQASISYTLGANVENLTLLGASNLNGTGNSLDNVILGNAGINALNGGAGNDVLDGGAGADTLTGGTGNDTLVVDSSLDVIVETATGGTDTIQASLSYDLQSSTPLANIENLTLTGSAALSGLGNALANTVIGNSGANAISGRDGSDTLYGGAGNDLLDGGNGADTLDGGSGGDTMTGGDGDDTYYVDAALDAVTESNAAATGGIDRVFSLVTFTLGANLEYLTLQGSAAINRTGNALDNFLTGNSGDNSLNGWGGADTLSGGLGDDILNGGALADTMIGGAGDDIYVVNAVGDIAQEAAGEGTDAVQASITFTIAAEIENLGLTGPAAASPSAPAAAFRRKPGAEGRSTAPGSGYMAPSDFATRRVGLRHEPVPCSLATAAVFLSSRRTGGELARG